MQTDRSIYNLIYIMVHTTILLEIRFCVILAGVVECLEWLMVPKDKMDHYSSWSNFADHGYVLPFREHAYYFMHTVGVPDDSPFQNQNKKFASISSNHLGDDNLYDIIIAIDGSVSAKLSHHECWVDGFTADLCCDSDAPWSEHKI